MHQYFAILTLFIVYFNTCGCIKFNHDLDDYLRAQSLSLESDRENFKKIRKRDDAETVVLSYAKNISVPVANNFSFVVFGQSCFISNPIELYCVSVNDGSSSIVAGMGIISSEIKNIKAFEYENLAVLSVVLKNSTIEVFNIKRDMRFIHVQSISHYNVTSTQFLSHKEGLFFIVATKIKMDLHGNVFFYKWIKTQFDQVTNLLTKSTTYIHTFGPHSEVIVLQESKNTISAFDFKYNVLRRLQKIVTERPVKVYTHFTDSQNYMSVHERGSINVYLWKGTYFKLLLNYQPTSVVLSSTIISKNGATYFIMFDQEGVKAINLNTKQMVSQIEYEFHDPKIMKVKFTNSTTGFMIYFRQSKSMDLSMISLNVESNVHKNDGLSQCLSQLRHEVDVKLLVRDKAKEPTFIDSKAAVDGARVLEDRDSTVAAGPPINTTEDNISALGLLFDSIQEDVDWTTEELGKFNEDTDQLTIKGDVKLIGALSSDNVQTDNLELGGLNGEEWAPHNWLMYKREQIISSPFSARNVSVRDLHLRTELNLFTGTLKRNNAEDVTLSGQVFVKDLVVNELKATTVNNITVDDMYIKRLGKPIEGLKTFKNMHVRKARIVNINGEAPDAALAMFTDSTLNDFAPKVEIENLWLEQIDNIDWNEFKDSVYQIGVTKSIEGHLIFSKIMTDKLNVKTLFKEPVDSFLTTNTDQDVQSFIRVRNAYTNNVEAKNINNVDTKTFVTLNPDEVNKINGSVALDNMKIMNKLELIGDFADVYMTDGARIIGTNDSDLLQFYNDEVYIKGDLHLKNVKLWDEAKLLLENKLVDRNYQKYWSKKKNQVIDVHVEATEGVTTKTLQTRQINDIEVNKILLNIDGDHEATNFYFENVTIAGDVYIDEENAVHTPDFNKIDTQGVKTNGSFVINGKKTFTNKLRVENLSTHKLGEINTFDVLTRKHSMKVTGKKSFKNVVVQKSAQFNDIDVEKVNNVSIKTHFDDALFLDSPVNASQIFFNSVSVTNLNAKNINERSVDDYIKKSDEILDKRVIRDLHIMGDAKISSMQDVVSINNLTMDELSKSNMSDIFDVPVKFMKKVTTKEFIVQDINDVDFKVLTDRILYKSGNQQVLAPYTFTNLKTDNLFADQINDKSLANIADRVKNLKVHSDLKFTSATVESIQAKGIRPCDFGTLMKNINSPIGMLWKNVQVEGNATFMDEDSDVHRLLHKTVKKDEDNVITAEVDFKHHVAARNIENEKQLINDINVEEMLIDALKNNHETMQEITGKKTFRQAIVSSALVKDKADVPVMNNVVMSELNNRIVRKNSDDLYITGKKTFFGGLQTKHIHTELISNIPPETLVSTANDAIVPVVRFDGIDVMNNFDVENVNSFNVDHVMRNKLNSNDSGVQFTNATYVFDTVEMIDLVTESINGIDFNDVVVDSGVQEVHSQKTFTNGLHIVGDAQIDYVDGVPISETFNNILMINQPENITGSITMMTPTKIMGNVQANKINGMSWDQIEHILSMERTKLRANSVYFDKKVINEIIENMLPLTRNLPSDYMYIEKSKILDIQMPNTISTKTVEAAGHVLIHVTSEENGDFCGLPKNCKCPMQQIIEMTPEHSIHTFFNKAVQRTYTYDDDDMILNVITNSVSSDTECRKDPKTLSQEVTSVTWSTKSTDTRNGSFYLFDEFVAGYVSGVEFFTIENSTYAIIGIYYDPIADDHRVNSRVIKFNDDKTAASTIQFIPTKGVKTLYLFHTAQGIILVLGNQHASDNVPEETEIYRFDVEKQQFMLLRTIPSYGCSTATGVVLNRDSLLVLAHDVHPILVMKYDPVYDNYYFYQSFNMEGPVLGVSVFYTGGFGISDAYLCIVSADEKYFIYSFQFIAGWRLESTGELEGLQKLIPFNVANDLFLLAPTTQFSTLFTVVKHGFK